jgi:hypothetical protein
MIFKKYAALALAATVSGVAAMPLLTIPVAGREFPPFGASGDAGFRDVCPPRQYLVGLRVRSGAWVDQMSITCAPLDADGTLGDLFQGPSRGGDTGGGPVVKTCNNGIVTGMGLHMTAGNRQVREFVLNCISAATYNNQGTISIGNSVAAFPSIRQTCPSTEAAIGIQGRYGRHVNAVGLICGTKPSRSEVAVMTARRCRAEGGIWQGGRCRLPGKGSGTASGPVPPEWAEMLQAHNDRRRLHCVPELTWNAQLAREAQDYANKCILGTHGSDGENMADAWATVIVGGKEQPKLPAKTDRQAFEDTWYCEIKNYDFKNPVFRGGFTRNCVDVNGHFTQVMWKDTRELGCGKATCTMKDENGNDRKGTHWVCRYNPPGNQGTSASVLKQQVQGVCNRSRPKRRPYR